MKRIERINAEITVEIESQNAAIYNASPFDFSYTSQRTQNHKLKFEPLKVLLQIAHI